MNGFALALFVLLAGQIDSSFSAPTLPNLSGAQGTKFNDTLPDQRPSLSTSFGWDIESRTDGTQALVYIIQMSPQEAAMMQRDAQNGIVVEPKYSDIPLELIGRFDRVLFQIGTGELPQNPPLLQVRSLLELKVPQADLASQLIGSDAGRLAEVERPSNLRNIQSNGSSRLYDLPGSPPPLTADTRGRNQATSGGLPPLPNSQGNSLSGASSKDDFLNSAAGDPPALSRNATADKFRRADVGNSLRDTTPQNTVAPNPLAPNPLTHNAAPNIATQNTASQNTAPFNLPNSPDLPSRGWTGSESASNYTADVRNDYSRLDSGYPAAVGQTANPQAPLNGSMSAYENQFSGFNNRQVQLQAPGNFGVAPQSTPGLSQRVEALMSQQPQAQSAQPANANQIDAFLQGLEYAKAQSQRTLLASADATGLPNAELPSTRPPKSEAPGGANRELTENGDTTPTGKTASNDTNILLALLLLSLSVNVFLGSLIRKLLTRYRTVMSNIRSQTA
ncbi:MAG: hypothetical protein KDB22_25020 [Planctomycetales bacterium]|nr:hypothetical protein [Planctomycetales bacterium]